MSYPKNHQNVIHIGERMKDIGSESFEETFNINLKTEKCFRQNVFAIGNEYYFRS